MTKVPLILAPFLDKIQKHLHFKNGDLVAEKSRGIDLDWQIVEYFYVWAKEIVWVQASFLNGTAVAHRLHLLVRFVPSQRCEVS